MKKLKKPSTLVVGTLALTIPASAGVIECPMSPPSQSPQTSPAGIQGGPTAEAVSKGAESAESDAYDSLKGAALILLESVALAHF